MVSERDYEELKEWLEVDPIEFLKEAKYVLENSGETQGKTTKGEIISSDFGYVQEFFEELTKVMKPDYTTDCILKLCVLNSKDNNKVNSKDNKKVHYFIVTADGKDVCEGTADMDNFNIGDYSKLCPRSCRSIRVEMC